MLTDMPRLGQRCLVESRLACNCDLRTDPKATRFVVIFKYLRHEWLLAKGFKERAVYNDMDRDGFEIDSRRTDRRASLLSQKRAREEASQSSSDGSGRSIRVSGERTCRKDKETDLLLCRSRRRTKSRWRSSRRGKVSRGRCRGCKCRMLSALFSLPARIQFQPLTPTE